MCMIKQVIVKCQLQIPGLEYINAPIDVLGLTICLTFSWYITGQNGIVNSFSFILIYIKSQITNSLLLMVTQHKFILYETLQ